VNHPSPATRSVSGQIKEARDDDDVDDDMDDKNGDDDDDDEDETRRRARTGSRTRPRKMKRTTNYDRTVVSFASPASACWASCFL
jgi:hypothetical protein